MEFVFTHRFEGGGGRALKWADKLTAAEAFGAAAVVLEKKNESVVELSVPFERLDNAADALVHVIDHRGVDFHAGGFPFFLFHFGPIPDGAGDFPARVDEAEGFHFFEAGLISRGVTAVVFAFIFGNVLGEGVHGPVGGGVGDVVEEGFFGMLFEVAVDVVDGIVGDRVGVIPGALWLVAGVVLGRDLGVVAGEGVGIEE